MTRPGPPSPCISVCALDEHGICRGCRRTLDEIAAWTRMGPDEQWAVIERTERRRAGGASNGASK